MQHRLAGKGAVEQLPGDRADLGPRRLDRDVRTKDAAGDEPGQQSQPVGGGLDPAQLVEQDQAVELDAADPEELTARDRTGRAFGDTERDAGPTRRQHRQRCRQSRAADRV